MTLAISLLIVCDICLSCWVMGYRVSVAVLWHQASQLSTRYELTKAVWVAGLYRYIQDFLPAWSLVWTSTCSCRSQLVPSSSTRTFGEWVLLVWLLVSCHGWHFGPRKWWLLSHVCMCAVASSWRCHLRTHQDLVLSTSGLEGMCMCAFLYVYVGWRVASCVRVIASSLIFWYFVVTWDNFSFVI